jgi:post-segregation antitoxin (ccd killing protein)
MASDKIRTTIRLLNVTHHDLEREAKEKGVSLSALINIKLAEANKQKTGT